MALLVTSATCISFAYINIRNINPMPYSAKTLQKQCYLSQKQQVLLWALAAKPFLLSIYLDSHADVQTRTGHILRVPREFWKNLKSSATIYCQFH